MNYTRLRDQDGAFKAVAEFRAHSRKYSVERGPVLEKVPSTSKARIVPVNSSSTSKLEGHNPDAKQEGGALLIEELMNPLITTASNVGLTCTNV